MGKKVLNRSNKNVKLRSILDASLKVNLDKEEFVNDWRFSNVALSVGALGIVSSCGNEKPTNGNNNKSDDNKLNLTWDKLGKLQNKFENEEEFKEFMRNIDSGLEENEVMNFISGISNAKIKEIIKSEKKIKKSADGKNILLGDKPIGVVNNSKFESNDQKPDEAPKIKGVDYDKLPDNIKESLNNLAENTELAKEFWNNIKNKEKIDDLINNDQELKKEYGIFKQEKENKQLIKNKLNDAKLDIDSQTKIIDYIDYLDNKIKVKLNNISANNYLFNKFKEGKELKQIDIVKYVENLYEQVVKNDKITDNIKKQLKSIIKIKFENLIKDNNEYKGKIKISDNDVSIEDNGKCKIKFISNIQNPKKQEYEIELEFFEINDENLKYKEVKDNKENDQDLSLKRLDNKNGDDGESNLDSYEFSNDDKLKLNELITQNIPGNPDPNSIEDKIKTAITEAINQIKTDDKFFNDPIKVYDRLNTFKTIIDDLLQGKVIKNSNKVFIEDLENLDKIYESMDNDKDKSKGETAFKGFIQTKFDAKRKEIYDFFGTTTESNFTSKVKTTLSGLELLDKKGKISGDKTLIEKINEKINDNFKTNCAESVKEYGDSASANSDSKLEFKVNTDRNDIDDVILEIATAFETIKSTTKQFSGSLDLSNVFGNLTTDNTIKKKLVDTLKGELNKLEFADDGTKTKAEVIKEYMDDKFKYYNNLSGFNKTDFDNKLKDSTKASISDGTNGLKDTNVDDVVNNILSVFGDAAKFKDFFGKLNALAVVDTKADTVDKSTALAKNGSSIANIQDDTGKAASAGNAAAAKIADVVKNLKTAVLAVGKAYDDWIKTVKCDEIKNLSNLIIADYKSDKTFIKSTDAGKEWCKLGNLLVKWMYVDSSNWDKDDGTQETNFKDSTKNFASCFFNKSSKYDNPAGSKTDTKCTLVWNNKDDKKTEINIFGNDGIGGKNINVKLIFKNIIWHECLREDDLSNAAFRIATKANADKFTEKDKIVLGTLNDEKNNVDGISDSVYVLLAIGGCNIKSSINTSDFGVYSEEHSNATNQLGKINEELENVSTN